MRDFLKSQLSRFAGRNITDPDAYGGSSDSASSASRAATTQTPDYPVRNAYAAARQFPWVFLSATRPAEDLSHLPLMVVKATKKTGKRPAPGVIEDESGQRYVVSDYARSQFNGGTVEILPGHVFHSKLRHMKAPESSVWWIQQCLLDLRIAASVYIVRSTYQRLNPQNVDIKTGPNGEVTQYKFTPHSSTNGQARYYSPSEILHISLPNLGLRDRGYWGTSPIEPLHKSLMTQLALSNHQRRAAERGSLQAFVTPAKGSPHWGPKQVRAYKDTIQKIGEGGDSMAIIGHPVDVVKTGVTSQELSALQVSEGVRTETLALGGIPPTRASLPGASYAGSRDEARAYWGYLKSFVGIFEAALSQLIGDQSTFVIFDFSQVEALQVSRSERFQQAVTLTHQLGAEPGDALAYTGSPDAPHGTRDEVAASGPAPGRPRKPGSQDGQEPREQVERQLAALFGDEEDRAPLIPAALRILNAAGFRLTSDIHARVALTVERPAEYMVRQAVLTPTEGGC